MASMIRQNTAYVSWRVAAQNRILRMSVPVVTFIYKWPLLLLFMCPLRVKKSTNQPATRRQSRCLWSVTRRNSDQPSTASVFQSYHTQHSYTCGPWPNVRYEPFNINVNYCRTQSLPCSKHSTTKSAVYRSLFWQCELKNTKFGTCNLILQNLRFFWVY